MKTCSICNEAIPTQRIQSIPNTQVCSACSNTPQYRAHLVVHHKTGHTYDVIADPETARTLSKLSKRNGFGSNLNSTASDGNVKKRIMYGASTTIHHTASIEVVRATMDELLALCKSGGQAAAYAQIDRLSHRDIFTSKQLNHLRNSVAQWQCSMNSTLTKAKPVGNRHRRAEAEKVTAEIAEAFRNWKM